MEEELRKNQGPDEEQGQQSPEEREPALPEGRAGGRHGETARQLIRRAQRASRRKFLAEEKIRIVMEGIHPTIYYKWLNDWSCIRLRPERANYVWSYDFVSSATRDGRTLRLLVLIDEYTRECLAIRVARRLGSNEVIETLANVMVWLGIPEHIRSDNGPEFVATDLRQWLGKVGTGALYIEPGSPWENGYCESFNAKMRDECLNGEIFYTLKEAQIVI
jgi:transposase InsO family protein